MNIYIDIATLRDGTGKTLAYDVNTHWSIDDGDDLSADVLNELKQKLDEIIQQGIERAQEQSRMDRTQIN